MKMETLCYKDYARGFYEIEVSHIDCGTQFIPINLTGKHYQDHLSRASCRSIE